MKNSMNIVDRVSYASYPSVEVDDTLPRCPVCGQIVRRIGYSSNGGYEYKDGKWMDNGGDFDAYCTVCDAPLDYEDLELLGIF